MSRSLEPRPDDDLDLPPLDGEDDEETEAVHEELEAADTGENLLDDATGEDDPLEEIETEGAETGWLAGAEVAATLDVGPIDLVSESEDASVLDDETEGDGPDDEIALGNEESFVDDAGEEGPADDDEELREEDLPALDADDDGDVEEQSFYDRAAIGADEELRWDDRAWARVDSDVGDIMDVVEESGPLPVPGVDPTQSARDSVWRRFEESGRLSAAALLPGGAVVVAIEEASRALLVRIRPDGVARIIAEIDRSDARAEADAWIVTGLRFRNGDGWLVATGAFGIQAFRPA